MSKAPDPLKLPASIKAAAARLAREDGVSLNRWIASAVAQKVGAVGTAGGLFRRRGEGARPGDLGAILARVPDPGDELPEGWRPWPRASLDGRSLAEAVRRHEPSPALNPARFTMGCALFMWQRVSRGHAMKTVTIAVAEGCRAARLEAAVDACMLRHHGGVTDPELIGM